MRRVCTDLPHPTQFVEHIYITLNDNIRLAARLFMPKDASSEHRYPAILEYIPYRKRNGTRIRDEPMHGFFAGHGYVAVRVDMRGAGESDGLLLDEYLKQEQDDALEVIDWISKQPWCTGDVGMMGKSWGGFNSLQVAARRPPALRAIIVLGFTHNRFTDDIHWKGGCLLNDNFWWGCIMQGFQSCPPDGDIVGDRWKEMWLERLDKMPLNAADWAEHQRYDAYWQHGSIQEDYSSIQVPVLLIDGWADSYTNALFHLLEGLKGPCKAICGPWAHVYPQDGTPLPRMNFLRAAKDWWDYWMKGMTANDVASWPVLQVYIEDSLPPCTIKPMAPGKWVAMDKWVNAEVPTVMYGLGAGRFLTEMGKDGATTATGTVMVHTPLNHGLISGEWMGVGTIGESAGDQRIDNGLAVTYTSAPLTAAMDILGQPIFSVTLTCDRPKGFLFAQMCDIAPDGAATRITYGIKNLVHCGPEGDRAIALVQPGQAVQVTVKMDFCGYCIPAGHSVSLSLANNYWPMVWCSPGDTTLLLDATTAVFRVPVLHPSATIVPGPDSIPEVAASTPMTVMAPGRVERSVSYEIVLDTWTCVTSVVGGVFGEGIPRLDDIDTTLEHSLRRELTLSNRDPLSARYTINQKFKVSRPHCVTDVNITSTQHCDADYLYIQSKIKAAHNDEGVFEKSFCRRVRREAI
ncbi:putative X-pro, dipeptidyl-peptidase,serine peptidase, Clan SC, family S15 [Leishmania major strain Friedlin]|uniref:Putative X-pro, dipeptidyl-peptidase,serine peptidase, Clan SC, family S15 n=1 Tax=Leishmania major TaxID=5664 RepID=Q4Q871_LEIMA|nr:putative X-pro, dipeptidyl-peptidase,serine peptidase, Clan SC, family S15 [Leishmania major strain Friedlin]CAG9577305.1 X-pro_-_dipeptidyl-peptidase_-serine_peptidase_-_Clan_SC_-_family_S15_-_putative [Leishmania major strain Friedlin]CAJ05595.1 putative X-pro, dipeptidyl-peptidase,serine peptidase, Clan SC, family S15 [Leishmania major strain Friedlin]|eukprot:XP_001684477.1 putative X-pro, dipeptidyl-peptidase,serine peptidase, Clan SC, family S15 [Leishmania major strain Friedlin]